MISFPKSIKKLNLHYFVFELTTSCNHDCIYCYNVWKYQKYPRGTMGVDSWKKVISKLKDETKIQVISLSGGEPLLYPDIFKLIEFNKKQGLSVNLLTNASKIDEKTAKRLVDLGVDIFEISLVAPNEKLHKKLKGTDDFEKVIRGLHNINEAGGKIVTVFVATADNIRYLKETLDLGIALGSRGLMFNRINPATKKQIELMPSIAEIKKAFAILNNFSKKYSYPISSSIPIQPCLIDMKTYPNISSGYCPSGNENSYYTIDSVGNVRFCNHSPDILGNILNTRFKEIVEEEKTRELTKAAPAYCSGCVISRNCFGGCKASAQVCYGSITDKDPFLEVNKEKG